MKHCIGVRWELKIMQVYSALYINAPMPCYFSSHFGSVENRINSLKNQFSILYNLLFISNHLAAIKMNSVRFLMIVHLITISAHSAPLENMKSGLTALELVMVSMHSFRLICIYCSSFLNFFFAEKDFF